MPISRSFYFIRHGQTDWNVQKKLQGSVDTVLNEVGKEQARASIPYFKNLKIDLIVSSPLKRAFETSEIIAEAIGCSIETNDNLRERYCGFGEGRDYTKFQEGYEKNPEQDFSIDEIGFYVPKDAEQFNDFKERILKTIDQIVTQHSGKNILISGHGIFFEVLRFVLLGEHIFCENGIPYYIQKRSDNSWNIAKVTL